MPAKVFVLRTVLLGCCLGLGALVACRPSPAPVAPPPRDDVQEVAPPAVPPTDHESPTEAEQLPGFREKAGEAGLNFEMRFLPGEQGENFKINLYDHGCGVAIADYDADGDDDVYFLNQLGPNALYRNDGHNRFTDVTAESGPIALDDRICVAAAFADIDNDGDQDLYVTSTRGGNVLFRNDQGVFVDVTKEAGLELVAHSQSAAFFDYDNDRDLDLLVVNTAQWTLEEYHADEHYYTGPATLLALSASPPEENNFYRNEGNGHFTDITAEVGLEGLGWTGDIAVFDYDEDGRLDVFLSNMFGRAQLYRNQPDGKFLDVTADTLQKTSTGGVGARAFDFNGDGRLDLYLVDMHSDMWMPAEFDLSRLDPAKKYSLPNAIPEIEGRLDQRAVEDFRAREPHSILGNSAFLNLGEGRFEEVSDAWGMETLWPWGVAPGDFDSDGRNDVFVPSGMGYPFGYWRNYLLMNRGDRFVDESRNRGLDPPPGGRLLPQPIGGQPAPRSSRTAATADFDGDGRLDLVVNNFNDRAHYFHNEFHPRHWLALRLRGTRSHPDAVGAVVRLHVGESVQVQQVQAAGGYLSQSSKTLHFGLGDRTDVERIEIRWPSGATQTLSGLAIDQLHDITEPDE